ncbi:MAG: hypothetical protein V1875_08115 [Candidatus Altiarchaeota archaeon]
MKKQLSAKTAWTILILSLAVYAVLGAAYLKNFGIFLNKPGGQAWDQAKSVMSASGYGGEPIAFDPGWLYNYATDLGRFGGFNLSECRGCESYWLLTLDENPLPQGYQAVYSQNVQGILVRKAAAVGSKAQRQGSLIAADPSIYMISASGTRRCGFTKGALSRDCYTEYWQKIERKVVTSGGQSRLCMFVHPRNGTTIELVFSGVRLGNRLTVSSAVADDKVGTTGGTVYLEVSVSGTALGKLTNPDKPGWVGASFDTSAYSSEDSEIRFRVSADNDERRHYCFDAKTEGV